MFRNTREALFNDGPSPYEPPTVPEADDLFADD
jgi:hypothetical protein